MAGLRGGRHPDPAPPARGAFGRSGRGLLLIYLFISPFLFATSAPERTNPLGTDPGQLPGWYPTFHFGSLCSLCPQTLRAAHTPLGRAGHWGIAVKRKTGAAFGKGKEAPRSDHQKTREAKQNTVQGKRSGESRRELNRPRESSRERFKINNK